MIQYLLLAAILAFGGQEPNIEHHLKRIENGEMTEVRAELPALLKTYPSNPGVLYLQALLTSDGTEAVRLYQNIVDTYPKSEWADDALWKIHQFYSAIGLHRTAEIKLNQLRTNYPDSKYIAGTLPTIAERKENKSPDPLGPPREKTDVESPEPLTTERASNEMYTLQVGVYSQYANARRQAQFFEYRNMPARIVTKTKDGRELFYVFAGSFANKEDAHARGEELKQTFNIDYFVVTQ